MNIKVIKGDNNMYISAYAECEKNNGSTLRVLNIPVRTSDEGDFKLEMRDGIIIEHFAKNHSQNVDSIEYMDVAKCYDGVSLTSLLDGSLNKENLC